MRNNFFKIAWRNLKKNKTYSFINIFGLSLGLTCCFLITFYLAYEFSYDKYHHDGERVFQLGTIFVKTGKEDRTANTPARMAQAMQAEFPEIESGTRLLRAFADDKTLLQVKGAKGEFISFYETGGYLADSNFFSLLTYTFKEGNPATALAEPNSLVLSEEIAFKLFGNASALNQIIHINSSTNGSYDFKVTGVFKPSANPTHIDARFFMSMMGGDMGNYIRRQTDLVSNNMFYTYLKLKPGTSYKKLERKFPAFIDKYAGADLKAMGFYKKQFLVPLKDIHLRADTTSNVTPGGSILYLYILGSIALFTLLIACINFMNLSTARSSKRATEVGVRKVLGAEKHSLIRQFLGESIIMAMIAFLLAVCMTILLFPTFRVVSGKAIHFSLKENGTLILGFLMLTLIAGLVAGSYPALYLSSFHPLRVLKGRISNSLSVVNLRKGLVVFQFMISAVLIISALVIHNQLQFLRNKDLGFQKDQQVVIPLRSTVAKQIYPQLKNRLLENPRITNAGASLYYPGIINPSDMPLYREGQNMNESRRVFMNWVDERFLNTLDIQLRAGRLFSAEFPADTSYRMILNEEAISKIGFRDAADAIGKKVMVDFRGVNYQFEIIGVVRDFHFRDLHLPIEPYGFQLNNSSQFNYLVAHMNTARVGETLMAIRKIWESLNPNEPFEYSFLDEDFQKNYEADNRLADIVTSFTILAILISCMGLFGLATFSAETRVREIGLRKVLGASEFNIIFLLSGEFLKQVALGILIAAPMAWYGMTRWLQDFAYRTEISWSIFAITILVAIFIAMMTISFQAVRAARSNPARALRTE